MKEININNNDNIKLQGIFYYHDCYKYWDLNISKEPFEKEYFYLVDRINLDGQLWNFRGLHNQFYPMCVIDLNDYNNSFEKYYSCLPKNIKRDEKLSKKKRYYFKEFNFNHNINDFVNINLSKKNVNPWYYNPKEFFANSHSGFLHHWEDETHYSRWYGIFKYYKHYKQDHLTTNEKLFAYCKIAYDGELATVHLIFGHQDNLRDGIMSHLLVSIIENCFINQNIKYVVYGPWNENSFRWKSRFLFRTSTIKYIL